MTLSRLHLIFLASVLWTASAAAQPPFVGHDRCIACHNNLVTAVGEDVSFGYGWRPSMMANAARDPYWQAGVRRETIDHPEAAAEIENECSTCHMPMAHYLDKVAGTKTGVFANLAAGTPLAVDGVSCAVCHRITDEKLGSSESFVGGFKIDLVRRDVFGPHAVDSGLQRIMSSASTLEPQQGEHIQSSELCATCHTLFTNALGPDGSVVGRLPEQVPYLEWRQSAFPAEKTSCQSCHLPVVDSEVPIANVLSAPREHFSRHTFRGGNFLLPRILNRYRQELGVVAPAQELDALSGRAQHHLETASATIAIENVRAAGGVVEAEVVVTNRAGHKLPTAYPSRRAWIHFTVRDRQGQVLFESGRLTKKGSIEGNDNDDDASRFEPHYEVIERPDQVQVFEAILQDHAGAVTTGLLSATTYVKDNRLLPRGFRKSGAPEDVAVRGGAVQDSSFDAGGDRIRYRISVSGAAASVEAELRYQPISYRWAENLRGYDAFEPQRFVGYFESVAPASSVVLASAESAITGAK